MQLSILQQPHGEQSWLLRYTASGHRLTAFKLSKLSDIPQEKFSSNFKIGSESHTHTHTHTYICWKEGWHSSFCLSCGHKKYISYVLERQNNFISCAKLALRDFKETSVTKLQALHFIRYCFISQEDEATRASLRVKLFQQFFSSSMQ
jgi:hypothetical protein